MVVESVKLVVVVETVEVVEAVVDVVRSDLARVEPVFCSKSFWTIVRA